MGGQETIAVFGLGLSGKASVKALQARGASCIAWDDNPAAREGLDEACLAPLDEAALQDCKALIAAPGIADTHPVLACARRLGLEILCDIELWHRFYPQAKTIGITGTNGKSTLTAMVNHIAQSCGVPAQMGGNIGTAVFALKPPPEESWTILELSSFQIERCPAFRPTIAALLNITPDHLDRHGTMANYAAIKARLFEGEGSAVIATDDENTRAIASAVKAERMRRLISVQGSKTAQMQNERMALEIASLMGIDCAAAQQALLSYQPLPHRQNIVRHLNGVTFVNDSKATNAQATRGALQRFDDIIWIVGGQPKDGGLKGVEGDLASVRFACVIGAQTRPFIDWLQAHHVACADCGTLANALEVALLQSAKIKGATILLSPACASYDQYLNFMQRGDEFTALVEALD